MKLLEKLESSIMKLKKENLEWKERIENLENVLKNNQKQINKLNTEIREIKSNFKDYADIDKKLSELEQAITEINNTLSKISSGVEIAEEVEKNIAEMQENFENKLNVIRSETEKLIDDKISKFLVSVNKEIRRLNKKIDEMGSIEERVKSSINQEMKNFSLEKIREDLNEINSQIEAIKNNLNDYIESLDEHIKNLFNKELRHVYRTQEEKSNEMLEILSLKMNEKLKDQVKNIKNEIYEKMFTKDDLVKFKKEKYELYKTIDAKKNELETMLEKGRKDIQNVNELFRSLEASKIQIDGMKKDVENRFNFMKNEIDIKIDGRMKKLMDDIDKKMKETDKRFSEICEKVEKFNERNDKLISSFSSLKADMGEVKEFIKDGINKKFDDFVSHINVNFDAFQKQISEGVKSDIEKINSILSELEKTIENNRMEFEAFREHVINSLNEVMDDYDRIKDEMNSLANMVSSVKISK